MGRRGINRGPRIAWGGGGVYNDDCHCSSHTEKGGVGDLPFSMLHGFVELPSSASVLELCLIIFRYSLLKIPGRSGNSGGIAIGSLLRYFMICKYMGINRL